MIQHCCSAVEVVKLNLCKWWDYTHGMQILYCYTSWLCIKRISAPQPSGGLPGVWLKWFQLNLSVMSSIPKSQWPGNHSTRLHFWDLDPTPTPTHPWNIMHLKLAWVTGAIKEDEGEFGAGVETVFVYERRRFVKIKVLGFQCFAWGKCVSDYTLHSCGGTLRELQVLLCVATYTLTWNLSASLLYILRYIG